MGAVHPVDLPHMSDETKRYPPRQHGVEPGPRVLVYIITTASAGAGIAIDGDTHMVQGQIIGEWRSQMAQWGTGVLAVCVLEERAGRTPAGTGNGYDSSIVVVQVRRDRDALTRSRKVNQ